MSNELRKQIFNELNLRETDDLLEIWQTNDHAEWSDDTFQVIEEILKSRGEEIPKQDKPVYEHIEEDKDEDLDFSDLEIKIIDDENPPDFYNPFDVIKTRKQIEMVARIMVVLIVIYSLVNYSTSFRIVQGFSPANPNSLIVYIITFLMIILNAAIGTLTIYFPLTALSRILTILMEMEFNSRKVNS